ncbi:MAG: alpha/beta fold hydrolase [Alphaproteobacteria bacterium]|nr:alpha/beta fold hydrolase [Alphaproteobacteria bacterium]MBV9694543.1 alpha/beta fold hydrolase [Alphaproteobacteria bacterium]
MIKTLIAAIALFGIAAPLAAAPAITEGDFNIRDFKFASGETLPELRLHYMTLGTAHRNRRGHVDNAVLILHGTGGDGHQFLRPQFAGVLFVSGGLLDPAKTFIILPDGIGHGRSSKPSDGLHARFPHYGYADMVAAQHALVRDGLHVDHLRLVMGTSMGCMHSFIWGETYPDMMDALMPLACLPMQIAGRNRMWRKMTMDAIRNDPAWNGGEYKSEPRDGLRTAADMLMIAGSAPLAMQKAFPTRDAADAFVTESVDRYLATLDANDLLYQVDASRDYDPSANLGTIKAPVMWVNSADDFINPPELGIAEKMVSAIPRGKFVLIPIGDQTHGHGTHTWAAVWKDRLAELLAESARE